ncbi:MAG: hypothetical protein WA857_13820 [Candidatus Acidiferrum sp.]
MAFKWNHGIAELFFAALCPVFAGLAAIALLLAPLLPAAQKPQDIQKKKINRDLYWHPPKFDSPVISVSSTPPCVLPDVLAQVAERTSEMVTDLQNFTAQERIQYQSKDVQGFVQTLGSDTFDYVVIFNHAPGKPVVEESLKPTHGSTFSSVAAQSRGLPEMVLLFLPDMQADYEMKCEGAADWEGQKTWVVHFQQRPDKPKRTFSFSGSGGVYPASLKGHAWIAADSGQVVHMEIGLMEEIPETRVRQWSLSIDYTPVRFRTQSTSVWLPQIADSYYDFGDHREIVYHTFTDFVLFSTQINQQIGAPKQP